MTLLLGRRVLVATVGVKAAALQKPLDKEFVRHQADGESRYVLLVAKV